MKMFYFMLFSSVIATYPAWAAEPDTAPAASGRPKAASLDGRVFFSAAERRALETKPPALDIPVAPPVPSPPLQRRFNGMLWRDGRIVALWFDGGTVDPASEPGIRLFDGVPGTTVSGQRQTLLPGQPWPPRNKAEP